MQIPTSLEQPIDFVSSFPPSIQNMSEKVWNIPSVWTALYLPYIAVLWFILIRSLIIINSWLWNVHDPNSIVKIRKGVWRQIQKLEFWCYANA